MRNAWMAEAIGNLGRTGSENGGRSVGYDESDSRTKVRTDGHFMVGTFTADDVRRTPPGGYPAIQVLYDARHRIVTIGPTHTPLVREGTPFVPLPADVKVYGRKRGASRKDLFDLTAYCKRRWWISVNTVDPHHILTDWDGAAFLGGEQTGRLIQEVKFEIAESRQVRRAREREEAKRATDDEAEPGAGAEGGEGSRG